MGFSLTGAVITDNNVWHGSMIFSVHISTVLYIIYLVLVLPERKVGEGGNIIFQLQMGNPGPRLVTWFVQSIQAS